MLLAVIAPTPMRSVFAVTAGSVIVAELAAALAELTVPVLSTPDHAVIAAVPAVLALMLNVYDPEPFPSAAVARFLNVESLIFGLPVPLLVKTAVQSPLGSVIVGVSSLIPTCASRRSPSRTAAGIVGVSDVEPAPF